MKKFAKLLLVSTLVIACMCMFTACSRSDRNDNNNNVESGDMANGVEQTPTPTGSPEPTMTPAPTDNATATMTPNDTNNGGVVDDIIHGAEDVVDGVVDGVGDTVDGVTDGVDEATTPGTQNNR